MTWRPHDDELDALARSLPAPTREASRLEQDRTSLLARAAGITQARKRSRAPMIGAIAISLAAAAAAVVWFAGRPAEVDKAAIVAIGPAQFERASSWPDFVVRTDDGFVSIHVGNLENADRFRVKTADAEVETRDAKFVVATERGRLTRVAVSAGLVEVRWAHERPVFLAAGQMWTPVRTAGVILETKSTPPPSIVAETTPQPTEHVSKPRITHHQAAEASPPPPQPRPAEIAPTPPTVVAPRPGEVEFRVGVAALRAGDANAATRSFSAACTAAQRDALGEDACFWVGAAAKRAGQSAVAREALARFLQLFPKSARAGEAAALLGWIVFDGGDLDAAEKYFHQAEADRVPSVRDSAQRGLAAIERKRSH